MSNHTCVQVIGACIMTGSGILLVQNQFSDYTILEADVALLIMNVKVAGSAEQFAKML